MGSTSNANLVFYDPLYAIAGTFAALLQMTVLAEVSGNAE
jgi:hypothetical protein